MQKKILTLAIAAAMAAPAAAMAEATLYGKLNVSIDYADVSNVAAGGFSNNYDTAIGRQAVPVTAQTPNGVIGVPGIRLDSNGNRITVPSGQDYKGWGISKGNGYIPGAGRASRIGVKGSEDLGNGLKAVYQVELGINLSDTNNDLDSGSDTISYRNSFVGLAGNWGTALVGRHDTPLKISTGKLDLFSDTMGDYNNTVGFDDLRIDNVIAYISPSFSGFSFMGAVVAGGGATAIGERNINEDSIAGAWSLAGIYSNGPFYASAAYESLDKDMFMNSATSLAGGRTAGCLDVRNPSLNTYAGNLQNVGGNPVAVQDPASCNYIDDSYNKWRIGLGLLDFNGFTLTAIYEHQENLPNTDGQQVIAYIDPQGRVNYSTTGMFEKQDLWQIQAAYAFGNNTIKAMYGSVERGDPEIFGATSNTLSLNNLRSDLEGDRYTWAIGFDHNFSKRTKAYVLYTQVEDDLDGVPGYEGIEWSGFSAGMMHSF